jgi:hypothetical protein
MPPNLPKYAECDYSLFVSYAHDDDTSNNKWVATLKDAIWDRLSRLDREIVKRQLHLSGENGPTVGHLSDELRNRVARSFGMLLVVGEQYVSSGWCEKELELFGEIFGAEGTKARLYIAVMSEKALQEAQQRTQWQKILTDDQLWVRMYREADPNEPLEQKRDDGSYTNEFFQNVKAIADPLIKCITADFKRSEDTASIGKPAAPMPETAGVEFAAHGVKRIGIGPFTPDLATKAERLKSALTREGAELVLLSEDLIFRYDPDDGTPLRQVLEKLDFVVVPVSEAKPLRPDITGGHTVILEQEGARLKKQLRIIWYRPDDVTVTAEQRAAPKHLEKFAQLAPVCASEQAVASELFGAGAGKGLKIYIENDDSELAFYRLAQELDAAWAALPPDPQRPQLRCETLDWSTVASATKDAAGVVLLLPAGRKSSASLAAQIKEVEERYFPKATAVAYPGCVALIFSPPPPPVSKHYWPFVSFQKSGEEPTYVTDERTKRMLGLFLNNVWMQYKKEITAVHH